MIKYVHQVNEKKTKKIKISLEIIRENIFKRILNIFFNFINDLKKKYKLNIYKLLKYKLTEYVSMWFWEQKLKYDPVIPFYKNLSYKYFIESINYYLNKNFTPNDFNCLKDKISHELIKSNNLLRKENNVKLKIEKIKLEENIKLQTVFKKKIYSILIKKKLYKQLKDKFKNFNKKNNYKKYIFCLCFRYFYIDASNQQLAIIPDIKKMFKNIGINFELFGSAINTYSSYYCSLYYDIEKYFGSQGSFFNIILKEGIYWCNPPYNNDIMTRCSLKLIDCLYNDNIGFIITVPIWDKETKKNIPKNISFNYNINKDRNLFKDYELYYNLKNYIIYELVIPQFKIPYYNYKEDKYIHAADTYIFFICNNINKTIKSNIKNIFEEIIKKYD